jgi:hypothetical protein
MEENNESTEFLGKMAMISEACQEVFNGKTSIAVELSEDEFINVFLIYPYVQMVYIFLYLSNDF